MTEITTLPSPERKVFFTGVGVVAPNGIGREAWWSATKEGRSGIDRITHFDPSRYATQLAGEVDGFDPGEAVPRRLQVQTDRWTHMALVATEEAFADADYDPSAHDEWTEGVITASSSGGNEFGQKEIEALWAKGPGFVGAYQSIAWFYAATTGQISIKHGMKGPCGVVLAEGAGGLEALQHSRRSIRRGFETVVSGGLEAPIGPYALTCQIANGLLSEAIDPAEAYRPFDSRANGYVPGEGGAIILVESGERVAERKPPHVYAELAGFGATNDAHHWGRPAPDGKQYARAMRVALDDAGLEPGDIKAVFADGLGHPEWDAIEARTLKEVFGEAGVPVTVPKSMTGRLYAGGASLDVASALLAMREGVIPPTINVDRPCEEASGLDLVTGSAREADLGAVLVAARGYGGFNAALVLKKA